MGRKLRDIAGRLRGVATDLEQLAEEQEGDTAAQALEIMERSCQSKRSYSTPEAAGQAAADRGVDGLRVYPCTFCKGFHLTKQALSTFKERRGA